MGPHGGESFAESMTRLALEQLRHHWGEAYDIRLTGGVWLAARRDGIGVPLEAVTAEALNDAITADYRERPVPR